ncbi:exo-alpha-sialidase [Rhodopirellula bahusiensis]|uniref:exo-alpha-sialidase n=1 Tax=Rhodopirellula bahusiensis TaxID=2014065 RepID=A0A2G1W652_9BACT|nr:exo-alpha-sialidase [Rhodopirellula bahusiensis]PHQ34514.1 sialidase [Rhodopirellula bahusiensis]
MFFSKMTSFATPAILAGLLTCTTVLAERPPTGVPEGVEKVLRIEPRPGNGRNSEGDFVRLKDGRLLLVYTKFIGTGDHAPAELVSRVSEDGGVTWTSDDESVIERGEEDANLMSVSLLRFQDGRIGLFYIRKYDPTPEAKHLFLDDILMRTSLDEGVSWSEPTRIVPKDTPSYSVLNNDRVIQLRSGRLVVPLAVHYRVGWPGYRKSAEMVCYLSDDGGTTWQRSTSALSSKSLAQEPGVVELSDGRLMMFCRSGKFQLLSYSDDQGDTWSDLTPSTFTQPTVSPASIERIPSSGDLLMLWNNGDDELAMKKPVGRRPFTAAISKDDGQTWQNIHNVGTDPEGWYCYTAIEFVDEHVLLAHCEYPRLNSLQLTRIPVSWFYQGDDVSADQGQDADNSPQSTLDYSVSLEVAHQGFDGKECWVHARVGAIPGDDGEPTAVMTTQKLLLSGSDVFYRLHESRKPAGADAWSELSPIDSFSRQKVQGDVTPRGGEAAPELLKEGDETTVCDFVPQWHAASQRLLGIGQTVWYRNNRVMHVRPRGIAYAVVDPKDQQWNDWKVVELPDEPRFRNAGSGSAQRVDLPGGDVLVPVYCKEPDRKQFSTLIVCCRFDGETLHYIEHGNAMTIPVERGMAEPSLTHFDGRFYMTIRNDQHGYVATSDDGLHFDEPRSWRFDDGEDLGSYNTQQHWVTHSNGLFLVYTRRGANNDHVFRNRAPLFIAQVDPQKLCVIRSTERVLVPEHGARLGNFGVTRVSQDETWVSVTEWMQPAGVEKHGSDNRIFIAKLKWSQPNELASMEHNPGLEADPTAYCQPPRELAKELGDCRSPLIFEDGTRVTKASNWPRRREEIRSRWESSMGEWPALISDPQVKILETAKVDSLTKHTVEFQWTPTERTTGYLLIPDTPTSASRKLPAVLAVYYEPETAIGEGKPHRDFALQLARRGFVTLSIGTTDASQAKTYSLYHPSIDDASVQPLSMLACAAANAWQVLADRPEVDGDRIGVVGHSFGGKWAMFAACLSERFACGVWSDPGIVFDESMSGVNYWEPWYLGYHPRPWRSRGMITDDNPAKGLYPHLVSDGHDLHELHALMAPRPFLVSGGSADPIHRWTALNHSVAVNQLLGHDDRVAMTNRADHSPNADSNSLIYAFFDKHLAKNRQASNDESN